MKEEHMSNNMWCMGFVLLVILGNLKTGTKWDKYYNNESRMCFLTRSDSLQQAGSKKIHQQQLENMHNQS